MSYASVSSRGIITCCAASHNYWANFSDWNRKLNERQGGIFGLWGPFLLTPLCFSLASVGHFEDSFVLSLCLVLVGMETPTFFPEKAILNCILVLFSSLRISIGPPQTVKCYYWKIQKDNTQLLPCIPACYRFLSRFHTLTSVLEMLEEENRGNYEEQVLAFSQLVKVGKLNVSLKSSKMKHIPPVKSDSWKIYFSRVFSNFIHHNWYQPYNISAGTVPQLAGKKLHDNYHKRLERN